MLSPSRVKTPKDSPFARLNGFGAKGDLSAARGGKIVDYENVLFDNFADEYYYTPGGELVLFVLSISSGDVLRQALTISLTPRCLMTKSHQVQPLNDAPTFVRIFTDARMFVLPQGIHVGLAMQYISYPGAKAPGYVHLISAGPG